MTDNKLATNLTGNIFEPNACCICSGGQDKQLVAIGKNTGQVRVQDSRTRSELLQISVSTESIQSVIFTSEWQFAFTQNGNLYGAKIFGEVKDIDDCTIEPIHFPLCNLLSIDIKENTAGEIVCCAVSNTQNVQIFKVLPEAPYIINIQKLDDCSKWCILNKNGTFTLNLTKENILQVISMDNTIVSQYKINEISSNITCKHSPTSSIVYSRIYSSMNTINNEQFIVCRYNNTIKLQKLVNINQLNLLWETTLNTDILSLDFSDNSHFQGKKKAIDFCVQHSHGAIFIICIGGRIHIWDINEHKHKHYFSEKFNELTDNEEYMEMECEFDLVELKEDKKDEIFLLDYEKHIQNPKHKYMHEKMQRVSLQYEPDPTLCFFRELAESSNPSQAESSDPSRCFTVAEYPI